MAHTRLRLAGGGIVLSGFGVPPLLPPGLALMARDRRNPGLQGDKKALSVHRGTTDDRHSTHEVEQLVAAHLHRDSKGP
jgi:hypothetical protein